MTGFVPGGELLILVRHGHAAALPSPANLVAGFFELRHGDGLLVGSSGQQSGLVQEIGQFSPRITRCAASNDGQIHGGIELHVLGMHFENGFAATNIRQIDGDLAVKAARTQQRGIEHIRPVGGCDNNNALLRVETVHLDEQGVERLFAFVVAAAQPMTAAAAHGVNFVDENKTWSVLARLLEHIAHAAGTNANEHFHEVGSADAEKGGVGFARNGLGQQGLACARGADHQDTLGDTTTQLLKFLGVFEEIDQFRDLFLGFLHTGNVLKGRLVLFLVEHAGLALAETEGALARHFDLPDEYEINQKRHKKDRTEAPNKVDHQRIRPFGLESGVGEDLLKLFLRQKDLRIKGNLARLAGLFDGGK